MMNDLIISNNDYLTDEEVDTLEWDDLDNSWIDNLGNCYKTLYDVPQFNLLFMNIKESSAGIIIAE